MKTNWLYILPVLIAFLSGLASEISLSWLRPNLPSITLIITSAIILVSLITYQLKGFVIEKPGFARAGMWDLLVKVLITTTLLVCFAALSSTFSTLASSHLLPVKHELFKITGLYLLLIGLTYWCSKLRVFSTSSSNIFYIAVTIISILMLLNAHTYYALWLYQLFIFSALITSMALITILLLNSSQRLSMAYDKAKTFSAKEHLIIPLSPNCGTGGNFSLVEGQLQVPSSKINNLETVAKDLDRHKWAMPLYAINFHLEKHTLKSITFVLSQDSNEKGSINSAELLAEWLYTWLQEHNYLVAIELLGASKYSEPYNPSKPNKPKAGLDFMNKDAVQTALEDHIFLLDEKPYYQSGDGVCIDITGGTKATSLASTLAAVNKPLFNSYTDTASKKIYGYDIAIHNPEKLA